MAADLTVPGTGLYLCDACEQISLRQHQVAGTLFFPAEEDGYKLRQTKASFEQALTDGCRLCCLVWSKLITMRDGDSEPWSDWNSLGPSDDIDLRYGFTKDSESRYNMGFWRGKDVLEPNIRRSFFLPIEVISDEAAQVQRAEQKSLIPSSTSTNSTGSLTLAKHLLAECLNKHVCSEHQSTNWAPSRLVDVGDELNGAPPRLCTVDANVRWLTLSHCWGKASNQCRLLKSNLPVYCKSLPVDDLSKTFRDALSVAKALGFQYLWIDSLCIIQDDPADWEREAVSMHKIYSLSTCTIAVSHASDGRGGCFSTRNPRLVLPLVMTIRLSSKAEGEVEESQLFCNVQALSLQERWKKNIENGPLFQRAWVFQERLLSPRTLYFGEEQILWGCGELEACESFPQSTPNLIDRSFSSDRRDFANNLRALDAANVKTIDHTWSKMISGYSNCKITFPEDRLPAFAGLMEALHVASKIPYANGVWLDQSIAWSLQWFHASHDRASRTIKLAGPSWSWLSPRTPVRCERWMMGKSMVKPLAFMHTDAHAAASADPLRQPDVLVIKAAIKFAWFIKAKPFSDGTPQYQFGPTKDENEQIIESSDIASVIDTHQINFEREYRDKATYPYSFILANPLERLDGNVLICLPTVNQEDRYKTTHGVVLQPVKENPLLYNTPKNEPAPEICSETKLPTFRRIGMYTILHGVRWAATTSEMSIAIV